MNSLAISKERQAINSTAGDYCGRFAPSPTGPLHMGSLIAALVSYLDARRHGGRWLLRIEDLDPPREAPGAAAGMIATLARCGFEWDGPIVYQSQRHELYAAALQQLQQQGDVYACGCTRREIGALALPGLDGPIYPGTCRQGLAAGRSARAWRYRVADAELCFDDRWQGRQCQNLSRQVGDFVLRRADGLWAYQLAVVADDAAQGVSDVVRGADLLDSTVRQIALQQSLQLPTPRYLHLPVLCNPVGEKLSKQTLAPALNAQAAVSELWRAAYYLGQQPDPALRNGGLQTLWQWLFNEFDWQRLPRQRRLEQAFAADASS